jgi:Ca2+-transporting ATPase
MAARWTGARADELFTGMTLQAIGAISDPVREDVPGAVNQCRKAGIDIKIVTGDTSATALEIAKQIGIWDESTPAEAAISGPEFQALNDDEAYERAHILRVMSRARPTDKQRLVEMLQKRGPKWWL